MKVLLTRPVEDAAETASLLRAGGHEVLLEPMLVVHPLDAASVDTAPFQAVLLTSRNGARALASATEDRDVAIMAVGRSTAAEARKAGFRTVHDADGNVDDLVGLVSLLLQPDAGPLLHVAGKQVAGNLQADLTGRGFEVHRQVLYQTAAPDTLSNRTRTALLDRQIDTALFFSPRSAESFVKLVTSEVELRQACASLHAVCISQKTAEALGGVPFRSRTVAERPNQDDLMAALAAISENETSVMSSDKDKKPDQDNDSEATPTTAASVPVTDDPVSDDQAKKPQDGDAERAAEPVETITEPLPVQVQAKKADGFARFLAFIAIILVLAVYGLSQRPEVPMGSAAKLAQLQSQVGDLTSQTAAATNAQTDPAVTQGLDAARAEITALQQQISNLSGAVSALETAQQTQPEIRDHTDALAALEARITTLESRPAAESAPSVVVANGGETDVSGLQENLAALSSELNALKGRVAEISSDQSDAAAMVQSEMSALESRLREGLDAEIATVTSRLAVLAAAARSAGDSRRGALADQAALLLAVGQLRDASAQGRPFTGAWEAVTTLGVDAQNYPVAAKAAAEGVTSAAALRDRFSALGSRAIVAGQVGEDENWVNGALKRVGNLVKVRRTGEVEGDSVEAIIARAEARLEQADYAAALTELDALQGGAAREVATWRQKLERRLALDAEIRGLHQSVLDALSGEGN